MADHQKHMVTVLIPRELQRKIRMHAVVIDSTVQQIVKDALEKYFEREDKRTARADARAAAKEGKEA